jgi:hypothetical protein
VGVGLISAAQNYFDASHEGELTLEEKLVSASLFFTERVQQLI